MNVRTHWHLTYSIIKNLSQIRFRIRYIKGWMCFNINIFYIDLLFDQFITTVEYSLIFAIAHPFHLFLPQNKPNHLRNTSLQHLILVKFQQHLHKIIPEYYINFHAVFAARSILLRWHSISPPPPSEHPPDPPASLTGNICKRDHERSFVFAKTELRIMTSLYHLPRRRRRRWHCAGPLTVLSELWRETRR